MTLKLGQTVPDIELLNQDGQRVKLSDLRGKKVIIFAFPKAGTAGCTTQACAFREKLPEISTRNAIVLGISTDSPAALKRWRDEEHFAYDLLSDVNHTVLEAWGAWGLPLFGIIKVPTTIRSYWVLDAQGILIDQQIGVGPKDSVQKALKAVGEVVNV